jgi:hypothetical protein
VLPSKLINERAVSSKKIPFASKNSVLMTLMAAGGEFLRRMA